MQSRLQSFALNWLWLFGTFSTGEANYPFGASSQEPRQLVSPSGTTGSLTPGIPSFNFEASTTGAFDLSNVQSIIVDAQYAYTVDGEGQTLIPPTLLQFAQTFAADLQSQLCSKVDVTTGRNSTPNSVFLTLGNAAEYTNLAGEQTSEGYTLSTDASGIVISGASPLGVWWGSRTVLQLGILMNNTLPYGTATDIPGWPTRGQFLDAGRHFYPKEFLIEMCSYMSYFKQNTFHVHLSDNLYNNVDIYSKERSLDLYARFRLWSDDPALAGLNKHRNESYTREDFDEVQYACAARGVTVIPEIEAPGHALVFVQWKPELGLESDLSLLNISQPETIATMELVWGQFLDWFHVKTVHIGADEYTGPVNDYDTFVNALDEYVAEVSGKSIRIWGTFPPNYTVGYTNIYQNVSVQHWEFFEDNPYYDYIKNNYSVLNSDDTFYVVTKWSGSYPQETNVSATFIGNSSGGHWHPNVFDTKNATNNPSASNPYVLGQVAALWNDYGANASVYSEAYYALREGIPALADKQWNGNLSRSEFDAAFATLHPHIPGQNLERTIPSEGTTIFNYSFSASQHSWGTWSPWNLSSTEVVDSSPNNYNGHTNCLKTEINTLQLDGQCSIITPLSSKGRNYTLSVSLYLNELVNPTNTTLITGGDSVLMLTPNVTLFASGNYYRLNSTLPAQTWTSLDIIARGNQTFARIGGGAEEEFLTQMGINGEYFVWAPMAIEAPLSVVGGPYSGWTGEIATLSLTSVA